MSGGAFNYGYSKIDRLQEDILQEIIERDCEIIPEIDNILVGKLLKLLGETSQIAKAVEWHFSSDSTLYNLDEVNELFGQQSQWIPISEGLPEEDEIVLITWQNRVGNWTSVASYEGDSQWSNCNQLLHSPEHQPVIALSLIHI